MAATDPKPPARVRDPHLLRRLHRIWRECALCGTGRRPLSLHHVSKHPRDDVQANLVMLCGSGTTGCHGRVEHHDPDAVTRLNAHLRGRPDTVAYLASRQREWLVAA